MRLTKKYVITTYHNDQTQKMHKRLDKITLGKRITLFDIARKRPTNPALKHTAVTEIYILEAVAMRLVRLHSKDNLVYSSMSTTRLNAMAEQLLPKTLEGALLDPEPAKPTPCGTLETFPMPCAEKAKQMSEHARIFRVFGKPLNPFTGEERHAIDTFQKLMTLTLEENSHKGNFSKYIENSSLSQKLNRLDVHLERVRKADNPITGRARLLDLANCAMFAYYGKGWEEKHSINKKPSVARETRLDGEATSTKFWAPSGHPWFNGAVTMTTSDQYFIKHLPDQAERVLTMNGVNVLRVYNPNVKRQNLPEVHKMIGYSEAVDIFIEAIKMLDKFYDTDDLTNPMWELLDIKRYVSKTDTQRLSDFSVKVLDQMELCSRSAGTMTDNAQKYSIQELAQNVKDFADKIHHNAQSGDLKDSADELVRLALSALMMHTKLTPDAQLAIQWQD